MLYELSSGPISFDVNRLSSLIFNPLLSDHNRCLALSNDLDPDCNLYSDLNTCDYYTEYNFNNKLSKTLTANSNCLSFFHLNIRSLPRHVDNLINYLSSINNKFSIIGISETWLQSNDSINLESYNFVHNYRRDRLGGGVGLYVDNSLNYRPHSDLSCDDSECVESLFVKICITKKKGIIVGIVYRPPNQNANDFVQYINLIMTRISKENKYIYLMGNFNLNLMNHESHQQTSEFLDIMYSNMLFPLIMQPTRITSYTTTLIDNIFTNHVTNYLFSGLLFIDISDNLPIFCFSYEQSSETIDDKFVVFRNKSKSNFINFDNQLNDTRWEDLFNDPKAAYDSFLKKFKDIYNSSFPLKKVKTIKLNLNHVSLKVCSSQLIGKIICIKNTLTILEQKMNACIKDIKIS